MGRCRSWKPKDIPGHTEHTPGSCRECWVPCHHRVPAGQKRCEACTAALVSHRNELVRLALASEPDVSRDALELLATDLKVSVATRAQDRLKELGEREDHDFSESDEGW